ncbi:MAG: hypothetical protein ACE5NN_01265 [Candidatus Bathyarchaeia archaeon]
MKVKAKIVIAVILVILVGFVGFELWGLAGRVKVPCSSICNIEVEVLVLPSEKQEFIDPETGAKIVRLTSDPSFDSFDYYEPSDWSPDDKKLKFVTSRFRDKFGDSVLHMIGTIDVETGEIIIYKTKYSIRWSEWSRDGRFIYGLALFEDKDFEPYFIAIDTQENTGKVLRLQYKIDELPEGFDEKVGASKDPEETEWLIKGQYRIPERAQFLHLNPSGTLAGFEMDDVFGVVDLENWKTWIVGIGRNRGAFFDDEHVAFGTLIPGGIVEKAVNVYTRREKTLDIANETFYTTIVCNHGNAFYENNQLAKIIVPGKHPTMEGGYAFYIYDIRDNTIDILGQTPEPNFGGPPASISSDGRRVAGIGSDAVIFVYDVETKKKATPFSGRFFDQFTAPFGAVGTSYGGQLQISHDGQKVAFVSSLYESEEKLKDAIEREKRGGEEDPTDIFVIYLEDELFKE